MSQISVHSQNSFITSLTWVPGGFHPQSAIRSLGMPTETVMGAGGECDVQLTTLSVHPLFRRRLKSHLFELAFN